MIKLDGEQDHTYAIMKYLRQTIFKVNYILETNSKLTKNAKYFEQGGDLIKESEKGSSFSNHFKPSFVGDVPYIKANLSRKIKHH
jgi:hypothetical protein